MTGKKIIKVINDGFQDYLPNNEGSGTLNTAGGVQV